MSSVYATEPAPSGRVLFETTHGPLEIQLWCRECPLITKLFLQLCVDGFYKDMIFHRIVPDLLIQTGALRQGRRPAGFDKKYQMAVQAPLALERRKYETHSRLRFNHRGQIAMALGVHDDDNEEIQPQFFITLDEAPYLDGKHVIFGTCAGPTIFNALRIGRIAVNENHLPKDLDNAPRIMTCKVIENPIHVSVAPLASVPWHIQEINLSAKKKTKRKGRKDFKLLSFGDEMDVEEGAAIKSSHDIGSSKILSQAIDEKSQQIENGENALRTSKMELPRKHSELVGIRGDIEGNPSKAQSGQRPSIDGTGTPSENFHPLPVIKESIEQQPNISLVEARLARFRTKAPARNRKSREDETMSKLSAFQNKVKKKTELRKGHYSDQGQLDNSLASRLARKAETNTDPVPEDSGEAYHGQLLADDEGDESNDWMATRFKCRRHIDHISRLERDESGGDGRHMNDYDVIDEKHQKSQERGIKRHRSNDHRHHRRR